MKAGQGIETTRSNWVFDEKVASHFDEHVRQSVPDYDRIQDLAASLADWFLQDGGTVIDLGASTGETLLRTQARCPQKKIKVLGYDNSRAMIQQAKAKGVDVHFCDLSMLTQVGYSRKARMHYWSNLNIKDILSRLRHHSSEEGSPRWEIPADVPAYYVTQMESEHRVQRGNRWQWE